jgi:hypothetical protein
MLEGKELRIPSWARVIIKALRFSRTERSPLPIAPEDWKAARQFCDLHHLTLPLALRCSERLPDPAKTHVTKALAAAAEHWRQVLEEYLRCAGAFERNGLEFVVLKGFAHSGLFVERPDLRFQYDLDLLFDRDQLSQARGIALQLGYEPITGSKHSPIDHLPTMIRKTGWQWRDDFFDPKIPVSLELHFRLWDEATECFSPEGLDRFWNRRIVRELEGFRFFSLDPVDAVAYSTLHSLRHLLRGDLRLSQIYELAWFLDTYADQSLFWEKWSALHHFSLRRLQSLMFALAARWFDCRLAPSVSRNIELLPRELQRWLDLFGDSPVERIFHPNKDEVWLHWALVPSRRSQLALLKRRLFPSALPGPVEAVHIPSEQITSVIWIRAQLAYGRHLLSRLLHHGRALITVVESATCWFGPSMNRELFRRIYKLFTSSGQTAL